MKKSYKDRRGQSKKSSANKKAALGGSIKDIIDKLNLRIKPEDGKVKFEGSYNDMEFHGIADQSQITIEGTYRGIQYSTTINYENFVGQMPSSVSQLVQEKSKDVSVDEQQISDIAKGLMEAIDETRKNGEQVENVVEEAAYASSEDNEKRHGGRASYKEKRTKGGSTMAKGGKSEIKYQGKTITKLFPSGYYEFYSDKEQRFIKSDDLDSIKERIDKESGSGSAMATGGKIKEGDIYHIDTDRVSQYEGMRIVDDVTIEQTPKRSDRRVLVRSPYLRATVFVPKSELKPMGIDKNELAKGGEAGKAKEAKKRLEELREELRAERISYAELAELQSLAKYIDPDDVELLEAAGVEEKSSGGSTMARGGEAGDLEVESVEKYAMNNQTGTTISYKEFINLR